MIGALVVVCFILFVLVLILFGKVSTLAEKVESMELRREKDFYKSNLPKKESPQSSETMTPSPPILPSSGEEPVTGGFVAESLTEPSFVNDSVEEKKAQESVSSVPSSPSEHQFIPEPVVQKKTGPRDFSAFLGKLGLQPPSGEEVNLMAWWSTRVGIVLGVISAVFFGLYVNQDTVPWVRLLELVLVAGVVFFLGIRLEKKLSNFGRMLSTGGLGLGYVASYASYGLPAMQVIESPWLSVLLQAVVIVGIGWWALRKKEQAIATLALVLGYATTVFATYEAIQPVPLIALILLTVGGSVLVWRQDWWACFFIGITGSGGGLLLLAWLRWSGDGSYGVIGISAAAGMMILWLFILFQKTALKGDFVQRFVPIAGGVGLLAAGVVTRVTGLEWWIYYAVFFTIFCGAALIWREDSKWAAGVRQMLVVKAMILLSLLVIEQAGGQARSFALLAQGAGLLHLGRRKRWPLFEVISLGVVFMGGRYLFLELESTADIFYGYAYLLLAAGLVYWWSRWRKGQESAFFGELLLTVIAIAWCWFSSEAKFTEGGPVLHLLAGCVLLGGVGAFLARERSWVASTIILLVSGGWLLIDVETAPSYKVFLWFGLAWAGAWLASRYFNRTIVRVSSFFLMLLSVMVIGGHIAELGSEVWTPCWLMGLALIGRAIEGRVLIRDLGRIANCTFFLAALSSFVWWYFSSDVLSFSLSLLLATAFWILDDFQEKRGVRCGQGWPWVRSVSVTLISVCALSQLFTGIGFVMALLVWSVMVQLAFRKLLVTPLIWMVAAACAISVFLVNRGDFASPGLVTTLVFGVLVYHGASLARSGFHKNLATPKVASLLWGSAAVFSLLVGLSRDEAMSSFLTSAWALGSVVLLVVGFCFRLRGYRMLGLLCLAFPLGRMFLVDIDEPLWRIVAFGVTGALLVGVGYIYQRFHRQLADGDYDWGKGEVAEENEANPDENSLREHKKCGRFRPH